MLDFAGEESHNLKIMANFSPQVTDLIKDRQALGEIVHGESAAFAEALHANPESLTSLFAANPDLVRRVEQGMKQSSDG
jgi:hypothetical protein